ncbi:hypothetical protein BO71DRAFT_452417 [Aspergillus ellipticus CBS 707.79]|uniref:Methyltransferase domain-containing protein n=1 Tax=Aspergillus ellipticus CBS 707.79 TaxID=1448320 RepID=A0A319EJ41_9EURO|nr:hypothetical protein BO71DRAFT_452417 [Aspergillus ellipticus CBS 707.79]
MAEMDPSIWFRRDIGPYLTDDSRFVYNQWGGIAEEDLPLHLHNIRDKAWRLSKYPCIGLWIFLLPGMGAFPQFPTLLARSQQPNSIVLDIGCGLGQELRLFAAHGVPTDRMWAVDIEPGLWTLGYDLFRDAGRMKARFIERDFRTLPDEAFHDLVASKRVVGLSKPGTMLVGSQQGRLQAEEYQWPWGVMFHHNLESFIRLWDEVQRKTNTRWTVDARMADVPEFGVQEEDISWMLEDKQWIRFVITRVA